MPVKIPGCHLYIYLYVPTISPLGFINLPEPLTELREMHHLLDYWFTIKSCNSGTARKSNIGQSMWKGMELPHCLLVYHPLSIFTSSPEPCSFKFLAKLKEEGRECGQTMGLLGPLNGTQYQQSLFYLHL